MEFLCTSQWDTSTIMGQTMCRTADGPKTEEIMHKILDMLRAADVILLEGMAEISGGVQ